MISVHRRLLPTAVAAVFVAAGDCTARSSAAQTDVATVISAWDARTARVRSFSVTWVGTQYLLGSGGAAVGPKPSVKSAGPHTFDWQLKFALDEKGRRRFDESGTQWNKKAGRFAPFSGIMIFDVESQLVYYPDGGVGFPSRHSEGESPGRRPAASVRSVVSGVSPTRP